jgi:hypothetical protein
MKTKTSRSRRHDRPKAGRARTCASPSASRPEFGLIGDNDLGAADLGPAAPGARDPDAGSGRMRKITSDGDRDTGRG